MRLCPHYPLFLNIDPHEFDYGWLVRPDDPIFRHRHPITVEITESVPIKYFTQCHSVLAEIRQKGMSLAIDDLGAGFSNLKYIADLQPEIVKLDRELILGCVPGNRPFKLLCSIVALCKEMNAKTIAEGIETTTEFNAAIEAGSTTPRATSSAGPPAPPPTSSGRAPRASPEGDQPGSWSASSSRVEIWVSCMSMRLARPSTLGR